MLKAVVLDLNNNQWGWDEVKKNKKNRKWSNPTVSDRCCRAECQLSGGLCVLSQVQQGSSLPACRLVLHLFPSSNVNVNLLFVHQTARRGTEGRRSLRNKLHSSGLRIFFIRHPERRTPRVLASGSNYFLSLFYTDDKIKHVPG